MSSSQLTALEETLSKGLRNFKGDKKQRRNYIYAVCRQGLSKNGENCDDEHTDHLARCMGRRLAGRKKHLIKQESLSEWEKNETLNQLHKDMIEDSIFSKLSEAHEYDCPVC